MSHHVVSCKPEHCHWGFFDAALKPILTVASGDTVQVDCVSGGPDILPKGDHWEILADHLAIHAGLDKGTGAHILTGPIAVAGAEPGDVLEVEILSVSPRQNWGYTRIRPHAGTLPEDFPIRKVLHSGIDRQRGVCTLPWGAEIDLAPFFGVMGVAPPPVYGHVHLDRAARVRRQHGSEGADRRARRSICRCSCRGRNFSCGDGHGVQGDGEVCVTALGNRAQRHLPAHRAQGPQVRPAARRDADPSHHDGVQRGPRRRGEGRAAGR